MKDRCLPDSFWHQPNRPPLYSDNITRPMGKNELFETRTGLIKITAPPDTNLLFSLFKILELPKQQLQMKDAADIEKSNRLELPTITNNNNDDGELQQQQQMPEENNNNVSSSCNREIIDDKDDFDDDEQEDTNILDDPYLSIKQELRIIKKTHSTQNRTNTNYSDILTDLVVNL